MANFLMGLISLTIGVVVLANVFIFTVKNTSLNTNESLGATWSAAEIAMWGLISLVAVVGMIYGVLNVFGLA